MLDFSVLNHLRQQSECDRLAELKDYAIDGTAPEPRFDAIVRAASSLLKAPMACVTLVGEERQWYKAAHGVPISESPRAISFCPHTIMSDEVMVIEDTFQDARFAANPFVTGEPGIRFYAGAPLITANGFRLGALCVLDVEPRQFSAEQRLVLKDLAALAMNQIEARRSELSTVALAGLAQSLAQPLLAVNPRGRIEFANRPAAEFFRMELDAIQGRQLDDLLSTGRLGFGAAALIETFGDSHCGVISRPLPRVAKRPDGSEVPVEMTVSRWDTPAGPGISVVVRDVAAEAARALGAAVVDLDDPGINDDRRLRTFLAERSQSDSATGLALLSIDGFETLCDALGKDTGNRVLQSVFLRLKTLLPEAFVGVPGKRDHFVVALAGLRADTDLAALGARLLESFNDPHDLGTRHLQLTASAGLALVSGNGDDLTERLTDAELALHEARRRGGNAVQLFNSELRTRSLERHQMQQALADALKRDEFRLVYQPQVSLEDGSLIGVEALLRWQHPRGAC